MPLYLHGDGLYQSLEETGHADTATKARLLSRGTGQPCTLVWSRWDPSGPDAHYPSGIFEPGYRCGDQPLVDVAISWVGGVVLLIDEVQRTGSSCAGSSSELLRVATPTAATRPRLSAPPLAHEIPEA